MESEPINNWSWSKFDREIGRLFKLMGEILSATSQFGKTDPIAESFQRYSNIYKKSEPKDHVYYFLEIYQNNRASILAYDNTWLDKGESISIIFGKELQKKGGRKNAIYLSSIYRTAEKMRIAAEEIENQKGGVGSSSTSLIPGGPEEEVKENDDLIRSEAIRLHLYRIFDEIVLSRISDRGRDAPPEEDSKKLKAIINKIEISLGIGEDAATDIAPPATNLFASIAQGFQQGGIKPPSGKMPTGEEIAKGVMNVVNNKNMQSIFDKLVIGAKGGNLQEVVQKTLGTLTDPTTIKTVTESFNNGMSSIGIPEMSPPSSIIEGETKKE